MHADITQENNLTHNK